MPRFRIKALLVVIALVALMLAALDSVHRRARRRVEQEALQAYYQALYARQRALMKQVKPTNLPTAKVKTIESPR